VSDAFLSEIRMFAGNFAPKGWAMCNGQLMSIQQNTALFSLLGTTYGGNGTSNFALPNLQASAPLHTGGTSSQGAGLSLHVLGEVGGSQNVTLLASEMPSHTHAPTASKNPANTGNPNNALVAATDPTNPIYVASSSPGSPLPFGPQAIAPAGGSQPHNNLQPYLVINFIIALQGIFPSRS
jgi:microcystin-dependent protein